MKKATAIVAVLLPALGGMAALSWEVIWHLKTSLAFGVSASGAAITLATMMAGMTVGASWCGRLLNKSTTDNHPLKIYGLLELLIGVCGLMLGMTFGWLADLDRILFQSQPALAPLAHLIGVVLVIFLPAACMGASIPVFGQISKRLNVSLSTMYGVNTLGAAAGTLIVAFVLIPSFGLQGTAICTAAINCIVGLIACTMRLPMAQNELDSQWESERQNDYPSWDVLTVVFVSGFVTFLLEVAWFRALRSAFETTTTGFAIMLAVVLLTLGIAARAVMAIKRSGIRIEVCLCAAAIAIFLGTPLIERLDLLLLQFGAHNTPVNWFLITTLLVGPAVFLLGLALPWHLASNYSPRALGKIYSVNTIGAVLGAIGAAWVLLPAIGFVHTAWVAGAVVLGTALLLYGKQLPIWCPAAGVAAFSLAVFFDTGVGSERILFSFPYGEHTVVAYHEGPDAATSAIEFENGSRGVFIDGFAAAAFWPTAHYMDWMGSLPALLQDDPKDALVICFGTGQTANAVRKEGVDHTTVVDINPAVFKIAKHFPDNDRVLEDPSVTPILMDGRAFLRRTDQMFDIITLEPMPPNHAGVNALYSREFYELAKSRLRPGGILAQWLPAHLVSTEHAKSVAKTFQDVFPNSCLWADPADINGILLGSRDDDGSVGSQWPGLDRSGPKRSLDADAIRNAMLLDRNQLPVYTSGSEVITDDNQLLAYGKRLSIKESGPRSTQVVLEEFESALDGKSSGR